MIDARDVWCERNGTRVLAGVSAHIDDGEFVLVVGANGAGKTTLLDICSGLRQPDGGHLRVDGRDAVADPTAVRTAVGRVFEEPFGQLLADTVRADVALGPENLGLPRPAIEKRVASALETVGMADRAGTPVDALSRGEAARVAIAGALAMHPAHLLLDEPTAGLDHPGRQRILAHLRSLREDGVSVLMATHDLRDLGPLVDRVIGLRDGGILFDAPHPDREALAAVGVRVPDDW